MPCVEVETGNDGTHEVHTVITDASGYFIQTNLPIGEYTVEVQKSGFRPGKRSGFFVVADAHLTANFTLQLGTATEAVTVTAELGEAINTTSGEVAHVIDTREVETLPLNGRNYTQVLTLIPGAVVTNPDIFAITTGLNSNNQVVNRQSRRLSQPDRGWSLQPGRGQQWEPH